jgi:hypothetical protein
MIISLPKIPFLFYRLFNAQQYTIRSKLSVVSLTSQSKKTQKSNERFDCDLDGVRDLTCMKKGPVGPEVGLLKEFNFCEKDLREFHKNVFVIIFIEELHVLVILLSNLCTKFS